MEPTDKDRLDWLDRHEFSAMHGYSRECCVINEGAPGRRELHVGTIREAIDSAMAAERSGAPGAFGEGESR